MLSFGTDNSIPGIEERLASFDLGKVDQELSLPANVSGFSPAVETSLIQAILTWAAFSKSKTLVTQIASGIDTDKIVRGLMGSDYLAAALLCAKAIKGAGNVDITTVASKAIQNEFARERTPFTAENSALKASLVIGHPSISPKSFSPFINLATEGQRGPRFGEFKKHVDHHLDTLYGMSSSVPLHGRKGDLSGVIYELFANAEEWGCTNLRNAPVKMPLRGILLKLHPVAVSPVSLNRHSDPLSAFMKSLAANPENIFALEASIFDSGVGLAQRHLNEEITMDEPLDREIAAVKSCLAKHTSSSEGSVRGLGLHHVMDLASRMKGFLRLRTGRLHLQRDFEKDPYFYSNVPREERIAKGKMLQEFQALSDWETNSQSITKQSYVKGVAYTLVLPMRQAQPKLL